MQKKLRGKNFLDEAIVLAFLITLLGFMPTARHSDRYIWVPVMALLLFRTVWLLVKREIRIPVDGNLFLYLLVYLWGLCSCFWSKDIGKFCTYTTTSLPVVLCATVCLSAYIGQRIPPERFLQLLIGAGVLAGLRYCAYTDWSGFAAGTYQRGSFARLLDDVTNYNEYTTILNVACVVALYEAIVEHRRQAILPAGLLIAMLLLGGSRKNIVAIPVTALLFALFAGNGGKKMKTILLLSGVLVLALYLLESVPALAQIRSALEGMVNGLGSGDEGDVDGSTQQRMYLMQQGIRVWMEHPFLGVGWYNYRFYNDAHLYAHNNYVELLASLGIVGFGLYYAMYVKELWRIGWAAFHRKLRKEDVLLLGFVGNILLTEFGAITLYGKERLVLVLLIFYWHSYTTKQKIYQFRWK